MLNNLSLTYSTPIPLDFYFAGQLEDYRVMNKLGQGQFGIVKLGVHVKTGERVALKIINKADLSETERSPLPFHSFDMLPLASFSSSLLIYHIFLHFISHFRHASSFISLALPCHHSAFLSVHHIAILSSVSIDSNYHFQ